MGEYDPRTLIEGEGDPVTDADSGWFHTGRYDSPISVTVHGLAAGDGVTVYRTNKSNPTASHTGAAVGSEITGGDGAREIAGHPQYIRVQGTSDGGNNSTIDAYLSGWRQGS